MAPNFLHGAEAIEVPQGARSIRQVKTAVIGLVGTAPIHLLADQNKASVNEITQVLGDQDAGEKAGADLDGYTIPQALDAIYAQGAGTVIMVNVFDPATHKKSVTGETATFSDDKLTLAETDGGIISATVKSSDGSTTYAEGEDYTIDRKTGEITRLSGGQIASGAEVTVDYDRGDPAAVEGTDVIGGTDSSGNRSGMQAFLNTFNRFGFWPKILIAPSYSTQRSVATEMQALADEQKLRAVALVDAPIGTTRDEAIAGRGPEGDIPFDFGDDRVILCFPHWRASAPDGGTRLEPYSQYWAGVRAATDINLGYWYSASNKSVKGVVGAEVDLSAMINNPTSDVNALNEAGIVTIFRSFGSGFRVWGNRSSAFPRDTSQTNFIQTRRTLDVIHESLEFAMLQFLDRPINSALIDGILESANDFIRTLIGRGALIQGSRVRWLKEDNPDSEIAAGHLTFRIDALPPPPAERITFKSHIDINLLQNLQAAA